MSSKHDPQSKSDPESHSTPEEPTSTTMLPTTKIAAVTNFLTMLNPFGGSGKPAPEFPPSNWGIQDAKNSGAGASEWDYDLNRWKSDIEQLKDFVKEEQKKEDDAREKENEGSGGDTGTDVPEEPQTIARRVRVMLEGLYPVNATAPAEPEKTDTIEEKVEEPSAEKKEGPVGENTGTSRSAEEQEEGTPKRAPSVSRMFPGLDWKTRTALFSDTVMNGAEKGKESVFAILERMNSRKSGEGGQAQEHQNDFMVYAPLSPDPSSTAELADSETVVDEGSEHSPDSKVRREWHPSPTKLSLQATWWGYRIYLPPDVLTVLSDAHLTAVKRGALISASLKWLLDQIPLVLVPLPLRPSVMMLKRLSPYLGYVGAFFAWSWEKIKAKDQGAFVCLFVCKMDLPRN